MSFAKASFSTRIAINESTFSHATWKESSKANDCNVLQTTIDIITLQEFYLPDLNIGSIVKSCAH
jgi:hypothetical protein